MSPECPVDTNHAHPLHVDIASRSTHHYIDCRLDLVLNRLIGIKGEGEISGHPPTSPIHSRKHLVISLPQEFFALAVKVGKTNITLQDLWTECIVDQIQILDHSQSRLWGIEEFGTEKYQTKVVRVDITSRVFQRFLVGTFCGCGGQRCQFYPEIGEGILQHSRCFVWAIQPYAMDFVTDEIAFLNGQLIQFLGKQNFGRGG
mmetsp:Transcript_15629/g.32328  ORF Transcript_15629/g.32328 Transcript_15629/m.32328 type:complete len:202 (-) Transcript_15629:149-754(-)